MKQPVCFQINLAAPDVRYVVHTLPHQLRAIADHVEEIQFTLDTRHLKTSKYRASDFTASLARMRSQLDALCASYPHAYVAEIDFSHATLREVSRALSLQSDLPIGAYNGSPFYGYVYGAYRARSRYVLHIDADMLFGGSCATWLEEAIAYLERDERYLAINPLAGPPAADGEIAQAYLERLAEPYPAFTFRTISSRIYLAERSKLLFERPLPLLPVTGKRRVQAFLNNVPAVLPFEECLSALLVSTGRVRLDFLGRDGGLWAIHPPFRSERFYRELPSIIDRIERGDVPAAQRGDFDVNDSMIDWSDVRRKNTRLSKLLRYASYAQSGIRERVAAHLPWVTRYS